MSRDSEDARHLINWRKGGAKTGANAGNFALVAAEVPRNDIFSVSKDGLFWLLIEWPSCCCMDLWDAGAAA